MRKKNNQHESNKMKFSYPLRSNSYVILSRIAVVLIPIQVFAILLWMYIADLSYFGTCLSIAVYAIAFFLIWIHRSRLFPIWMDDRHCSRLLDLCDQYSELNDYRLSVVHQGRRFTSAEYVAMTAWPEKKRAAEKLEAERKLAIVKCNQLYKIE